MKNILIITALSIASTLSHAGYDSNINGVVTNVLTYTDGRVYVVLENQPTSHPSCDSGYFALAASIPAEARNQMLSRLLLAYASKEIVNIGYDGQADCVNGKIRIHRVG